MRLLFMLLALLCGLASSVAQQTCQIGGLMTGFVLSDSANCKYSVKLNFQHQGTTNQFNVTGNGVNYGTFTYTSLPVTIGPIMGQANAPVVREFVVTDVVLGCSAFTVLTLPACSPVTTCEIYDASATAGDCQASGGFPLQINFKVQNPGNDFFEAWADNGAYLGTFPIASLPVTIPNFPANGLQTRKVKLCINDHPDCCKALEFQAPICTTPCDWQIQVDTGKCNADSTYAVLVHVASSVPLPPTDSFQVFGNGVLLGTYAWSQQPVSISHFPSGGGAFDVIRACAVKDSSNTSGTLCCVEKEFLAPTCVGYPDCAMSRIQLKTDSCTSDSTFRLTLNFMVADTMQVDSFSVFADGKFLGKYALSQLPLTLPDYPWVKGTIYSNIRICTGDLPGCCRERKFAVPPCLPFGPCHVTDIQIKTGPCRADGSFQAVINFQATNPGNGTFTVFGNGQNLGTFPIATIPVVVNFPSNGAAVDVVRICVNVKDPNTTPCCESKQFEGPDCPSPTCSIEGLTVVAGDCNPDGTFKAVVKFGVKNPTSDKFALYSNGQLIGNFSLSQLPLALNLSSNGAALDVVKVCLLGNTPIQTPCCAEVSFEGPTCGGACEISNLKIEPGTCTSDSTYKAVIRFDVFNPPSTKFAVVVNGINLGTYDLSQLPLTLNNLPSNGAATDVLKVCMVVPGAVTCCRTLEYQGTTCGNQNCEIYNLKIEPGTCTSDSTYKAVIRFDVFNPPSTKFAVVVNGINLGTYNLSQLPLTLNNLPSNGAATDVLKVCMVAGGAVTCCRTLEYQGTTCGNSGACEIYNLTAQVGDCTSDSTYKLTLNFQVHNPGNSLFEVWAGGTKYLGAFPLSQLPLAISNYPEGNAYHFVKVCINNHPDCCRIVQFAGRTCGSACEITNLHVQTGICTGDSTYKVTINFGVNNPLTDMFSVVGNGHFLGFFKLGQLPLTLEFPWNGGSFDLIEVCAVTAPGIACCKKIEFAVPDCILHPVCEIYDMTVTVGDCTSDSTYQAKINFKVTGSIAQTFTLWANGQVLGTYNLSQLPLAIQDFPWNGGLFDVVKVCMNAPDPTSTPCCRTKEFAVPTCLSQCDIVDLEMLTGDCTSDSTYKVKINFQVVGSSTNVFGVWVNGENTGFYNLSQLPLTVTVLSDGGLTDVIKVCLLGSNVGQVLCCRTKEVEVPACIDVNCHIWDVQVLKTPCLCGKFFAVVTFQHQHGGAGGFDIVGNGQNYGNFPYSSTQPIILGPLMGDGSTAYEFVVRDHLHPDCKDFAVLGKVECATPTDELSSGGGQMLLSPNPAKDRLNVTAQLDGKAFIGSAQVEIRHADGRLLQTLSMAEASNFSIDVSMLPGGVYRLTLIADAGRLEASFVKAE